MKTILITTMMMLTLAASAQTTDTISIQPSPEYLDFDKAKLEIPLQMYDSIMHSDIKVIPFGFVFQDGKAGIYDFQNLQLVTEIIYKRLFYTDIKEGEIDNYHMFQYETEDEYGLISVSESDRSVMRVVCKKEGEN